MKRILLAIEHDRNRQMLWQWLKEEYEVLSIEGQDDFSQANARLLEEDFDLCLVDYGAIRQLRQKILAKRKNAVPTFLPFVFLTPLQKIGFSTDSLEQLVDDIIYLPTQKKELQTKLRILLRSRSYSLRLKATQEELNRALSQERELNQLKSRFVSTVSHEFRNPLNSISGMTQILQTYGDNLTPEKKAEVLKQLRRNVTKMTNLLNDVLVISRSDLGKQEFQPSLLDLEVFCRGLIGEIQTVFDRHQPINFNYQAEPKYNLDRKLLHHILINLLSNACKYSPSDSTVDFKVVDKDCQIIFTVSDRGIGIPPADLPQLFDSFYRASNSEGIQGTGLGLAIAKQYTELHYGRIAVESELEVGTTFTVSIPNSSTVTNV